jgi:hypothetical protein
LVLTLAELRWAVARIVFLGYIGISMATGGLFGFLTGPLMTWYIYGDARVWRHWPSARRLFPHAFRMLFNLLRGYNGGFMLDVPLTAPPRSGVDPGVVELSPTWDFGLSCGPCSRCCTKIHCPVLDEVTGLCRGYNSFFWRYFACGRFPSAQREIDHYVCNKWEMKEPARRRRRRTLLQRNKQVA